MRQPTENISDCMLTCNLSVSSGAANYKLGTILYSPALKSKFKGTDSASLVENY